MEYQPRGGFKDGDTWELNTANRKERDGEGRTKICLGITGHLIRVSSILLPISVCTSASLPLPADPLPLSPQVRIWLCSLCGLGGRQPLHAGRVPPVLLLACQGTPRTAVPSADTALHSPGVCLSPNPALLLPSASLPSKKLPGPWHSHPAWTLNAPGDLSPPYLPCFSTIFSAETEVLIVPPPISIIVLLSQAGRHPQPCIAARPCLSVCLSQECWGGHAGRLVLVLVLQGHRASPTGVSCTEVLCTTATPLPHAVFRSKRGGKPVLGFPGMRFSFLTAPA